MYFYGAQKVHIYFFTISFGTMQISLRALNVKVKDSVLIRFKISFVPIYPCGTSVD